MTDLRDLARALEGRWYGRYGTEPCPVCQPERRRGQNAPTLADGHVGRILAHCKRLGRSFADIITAAGAAFGGLSRPRPGRGGATRREAGRRAEAQRKAGQAARLWREARPIEGTPAERYLREARGLGCPLPGTLRFHPECWHGTTARRLPVMVALVEGGGGFAVHRTYLRPDGSAKAAIAPAKAMPGAVAGGAVRLADGPGPVLLGDGVESTLAALVLRGDATSRGWAALSTPAHRGLRLPPESGRLGFSTDGDAAGLEAALAERASGLGWQVTIAEPRREPIGRACRPEKGGGGMNVYPFTERDFAPEEPQPLVREIPPGPAYRVEALGPLRPAVEAVRGAPSPRRNPGGIRARGGIAGGAGPR